jgi:hypothetical protein
MPGIRRLHDANLVTRFARGLVVPAAHRRPVPVVSPDHEDLRKTERHELARRDQKVALGLRGRRAAHELLDDVVADALLVEIGEVGRGSEGENGEGNHRLCRGEDRAVGEAPPRAQPERELPSRRVSHREHAIEIEGVLLRHRTQVVGALRHVRECARPAAARISDPAILERPGRDSFPGERRRELPDVGEVVPGQPAASVDEEDDRVRAGAARKPQLAELERVLAIGDLPVRRG